MWSQQGAKLVGTGAVGPFGAEQGSSVSLSGDGKTAIVGGPFDDDEAGAAWVYTEPRFAGTPGHANCYGKSVSALARQFRGLNAAAAALGFPSVPARHSIRNIAAGDPSPFWAYQPKLSPILPIWPHDPTPMRLSYLIAVTVQSDLL